jgi:protein translocase SEC61 complex gamma subunit
MIAMDIIGKIKNFISNARHILYVSYKPTPERYWKTAKIILVGIILMGSLGFVIAIVISLATTGSLSLI